MELMDPKLQLVTGCALVAFFSHTNLSLFNIHLSTPVHKYGRSTSSYILLFSIFHPVRSLISDVVCWAIQSNNLDHVAVKLWATAVADFTQSALLTHRVNSFYTKLLILDFCLGIIKSIVLELNLKSKWCKCFYLYFEYFELC